MVIIQFQKVEKITKILFYNDFNFENVIKTDEVIWWLNPLPCGTIANFFLTAVGPIQHTKEGDNGREKTILMTSLRLERAAAMSRSQLLITPLPPTYRGQCVESHVMT